jgi:hypothetical protein
MFLRKYGVATEIVFPVIKAGSTNLAASADWTPATGETKISKDGANVANTTNNPAAVGGTGSVLWSLTLTATEMQAARIVIQIVDSPTKAIEDQVLVIETYGHASAQHELDLDDPGAKIADELLKRPISNVESGVAFRTLYGAVASLVNRRRILSGNLEIFKTDDTTKIATIPATTDAGQQPITELDPP